MDDGDNALRHLPRIDAMVASAGDLVRAYGRRAVTGALRETVAAARQDITAGAPVPPAEQLVARAQGRLADALPGPPRAVINATGVVIHTNLGRAPLSAAARAAMDEAAGYCDVELDLSSGRRGSRNARLNAAVVAATSAEAGLAVNNAAAGLVLALAALAAGRPVLVSRGELVEIGGSFRLPEIMAAAGVDLVEVGTTNRTRAADYAGRSDAALLLRVHPSNYRISGFTEAPGVAELAAVAGQRGIPLLHDIGSGLLQPRPEPWLDEEPTASGSLAAGADLVLFSGDKLLGGPQAGLLVGRADLVARCAGHPLARALRLDKQRIAGLTVTLETHARERAGELPVWQALTAAPAALKTRLDAIAHRVGGSIVPGASLVGGGAAPERPIPSPVLQLSCGSAGTVAARLRHGRPAVVVRVDGDAVLVDVRTVDPSADADLAARLAEELAEDRTTQRPQHP